MSIALGVFCLVVELMMPNEVELSVSFVVGGYWWPISSSVVGSGTLLFPLWKSVTSLASADDATTWRSTWQ